MSKVVVETVEQLDEMRAQTIADRDGNTVPFYEMKQASRLYYLNRARAIREADQQAGLFTVPAEQTLEMPNAAAAAEDHGGDGGTWAAKLLASPFAPVRECGGMIAWQPIETAPRDGTRILLWVDHPADQYARNVGAPSGWCMADIGHWNEMREEWSRTIAGDVTHWQPLPEPPKP